MLVRSALVRMATADGVVQVDHGVRLALGGVGDHHRHVERPGPVEVAVVVVALDHHHLLALGHQALHHPDADRAEPDDHHVAGHARDAAAPERLLDASAHQDVGEQGESTW